MEPKVTPTLRRLVASAFAFSLGCGGAPAAAPRSGDARSTPSPSATMAAAPSGVASEDEGDVPIRTDEPSWGSRTAPVTIVEFADFECPFCARVEDTLADVRKLFGPEKVRIVWKNYPLPFHKNAKLAAEAGAGVFALAGNDGFWKFHDAALRRESPLGWDTIEAWAKDAGVKDAEKFRAALTRHEWASGIDKDTAEAKDLGANGTPTFFVNGLPLLGALPFPTFQVLINEQLGIAQAKIAAGTTPERLYIDLVKDNRAKLAANPPKVDDDDDEDKAEAKAIYKVPVGASPVRGSRDALVTIVEFADYECPFCIRVEPTLRELETEFGDKLRIVYKDLPLSFHPRAEPAAEAALEVRAEKGDVAFWQMHDALLAEPSDLNDETLVAMAVHAGATPDAVKKAIAGHTHRKSIEQDVDLGDDVKANGTPHFFINGRRLVGAQPKETFESLIHEELARAQGLVAQGTKLDVLYDALQRDGQGAVEPEKKTLPASLATAATRAPTRGNAAAKVTVHEWSDFQCPFCKRVEPTLARLADEYGGKIRIVWHDMPLPMHPDAPLAARAAREALAQKGEKTFWTLHDQLFAHQNELARGDLDGYARGLGLDMTKWNAALDGQAHQAEIDADRNAADGMGIGGTPAFVVVAKGSPNGYFLSGAQPYPRFRKVVERALAEAK
jgi:protein-disulfide isomerase